MNKIDYTLSNPLAGFVSPSCVPLEEKAFEPTILSTISRVFQNALLAVMIAFQQLKYLVYVLLKNAADEDENFVFQNQIIVETRNDGKFNDIEAYNYMQKTPLVLNQQGKDLLKISNLQTDDIKLSPNVSTDGKCFGGVSQFLADYLTTADVHATAHKFKEGIPLEGIIHHEIYEQVFKLADDLIPHVYPLTSEITKVYCRASKGHNIPDWKDETFSQFLEQQIHILEAIYDFAKDPLRTGEKLTSYVKNWVDIVYNEKIADKDLLSLKMFTFVQKYEDHWLLLCEQTILAFSGLKIETVLSEQKGPNEILDKLTHLQPGAYELSYPVYSSNEKIGEHVVALIVESTGISYLYNPNTAVGWCTNQELPQMVTRLFQQDCGFMNKSTWQRLRDFIFGKNLAKEAQKNQGYSLYKIRKISDKTNKKQAQGA